MKKTLIFLSILALTACANTSAGLPTPANSSQETPAEAAIETPAAETNPAIDTFHAELPAVTANPDAYFPQLSPVVPEEEAEVKVVTSKGEMIIRLFPKYAPLSVQNFLTQVKEGQYNGITIGPTGQNYIVQSNYSKKGSSIWKDVDPQIDPGTGFTAEISPYLYNLRGAVTMISGGPHTANSIFFINSNTSDNSPHLSAEKYHSRIIEAYKNGGNSGLDGFYGVFGQVSSGFETLDAIAATLNAENQLTETVTIDSIEVTRDYTL